MPLSPSLFEALSCTLIYLLITCVEKHVKLPVKPDPRAQPINHYYKLTIANQSKVRKQFTSLEFEVLKKHLRKMIRMQF